MRQGWAWWVVVVVVGIERTVAGRAKELGNVGGQLPRFSCRQYDEWNYDHIFDYRRQFRQGWYPRDESQW